LPFLILPGDVVAVVAGAVVICFLATLYPSRQAARLDPAQALRYE
jgi:lipoprotein-releasing system permease protein